ncbi:MAG: 4-hydroxybenzoate octaprenyltransferase, partial [Proteobacteria bacterium]|nr:4-hydroxybenzoate octaprenyltransferase [Pseudomonadota bacterium]
MASDHHPQSLVMRLCPPFLRSYVLLARLDRPVPILLLMLPGLWGLLASMRDARPALH